MRISDLSRTTGVPVASIKFYIREGLLPRGRPTAPNQADYDKEHVERLTLIRALREVAGLPVAVIGDVVAALDGAGDGSPALTTALRALAPDGADVSAAARVTVRQLIDELDWSVDEESAGYSMLEAALTALDEHWPNGYSVERLRAYADLAGRMAEIEIPEDWDPQGKATPSLVYAVLGTILYEPVILALRRLAHADRHRRLMQ